MKGGIGWVSLSREIDGNYVTSILHYHLREFLWRNADIKIILSIISIKNEQIVIWANLRFSGSCRISSFPDWLRICLIWSVYKYYKSYTKSQIYTFWFNFDTVLYQFLETETSDRCLICIVQHLRFSGLFLYPLSFSFTVPIRSHCRTVQGLNQPLICVFMLLTSR